MSVMPVRTDPGLHYSQEVYMMETMQHNVEHKQTHIQQDSTFFTLKNTKQLVALFVTAPFYADIKMQTHLC